MRLKILLPTHTLVDEAINKVTAEAENGSFTLLPRHVDFVTSLIPGLLIFKTEAGEEVFLAVDGGLLVKHGAEVRVSTRNAMRGASLTRLRETVEKEFHNLDEQEKKARSALLRLETDIVRRFIELGKRQP